MTNSWWMFIALAIVALAFFLWPLYARFIFRTQAIALNNSLHERLETNIQLFHEHMAELESALHEGRMSAEQFAQLKLEQERHLLNDKANVEQVAKSRSFGLGGALIVVVSVTLMGAAFALYHHWGSAPDVSIQTLQVRKDQLDYQDLLHNRKPDTARSMALITALEARLIERPENTQNWFMLARAAMEIGDFASAVKAYQKILALDPQASIVMAELAQALFLRDNNRISSSIMELAQSALKIDPNNTTALGLAGIDAFERKDYAATINYWERAIAVLGAEAPGSHALQSGVARARSEAEKAGVDLSTPKAVGRSITATIALAPELNLATDLPVFVYVRAWQGGRIPLAIQKLTVGQLPIQIVLDESMAMSPEVSLAQADQIELVARVALDGSATAKAGDWQGSLGPLDINQLPALITVTIDQKLAE